MLHLDNITLKEEQRLVMEASGKDCFVCLPTWIRKKCVLPSLVIIVSPLLSLIADQVCSLRDRSVKCSIVTSCDTNGISKELLATATSLLTDSLVYCTSEALVCSKW